MRQVRLIESEWGGRALQASGVLSLYGIEPEIVTIRDRETLVRLLEEARGADHPTILLVGPGFLNQLGKDVPQVIPGDIENLKVLWMGVDPGGHPAGQHRIPDDEGVHWGVLAALGEPEAPLRELLATVQGELGPRFDPPVVSYGVLFCYDSANDLELHLPFPDIRMHRDKGDLGGWLQRLVMKANVGNA